MSTSVSFPLAVTLNCGKGASMCKKIPLGLINGSENEVRTRRMYPPRNENLSFISPLNPTLIATYGFCFRFLLDSKKGLLVIIIIVH